MPPALVSSQPRVEGDLSTAVDRPPRRAARPRCAPVAGYVAVRDSALLALGRVMRLRDPETQRHQEQVAQVAVAIAQALRLDPAETETIRCAALLHDIGKVGIPAEVAGKIGPLSIADIRLLQGHAASGCQILDGIDFGGPVAEIVAQHHERLDGSGYPRGLVGAAILRGARVVAVADVLEAMVGPRRYRKPPGADAAFIELREGRGRLYDPMVVDACLVLSQSQAFVELLDRGSAQPGRLPADLRAGDLPRRGLTLQQRAVMNLLAEGLTVKEIARRLDLGVGTVKVHLSRAYAVLGVSNRVAALQVAGLLSRSSD